jgi:RNase P/RNase MRP subunit p30
MCIKSTFFVSTILDIDNLSVGNLDVNILSVGNLDVDILSVDIVGR